MAKSDFLTELQSVMADVKANYPQWGKDRADAFTILRARMLGIWEKHKKEMTKDERVHLEAFLGKMEEARARVMDEEQEKEKADGAEELCPRIEEEEVHPPLED